MFIVIFITIIIVAAVVYCPGTANRKSTSMALGRRTAFGYLIEELVKYHHHLGDSIHVCPSHDPRGSMTPGY